MELLKKVLRALYERVWVAKKSTFLGLGLLAGEVVVQEMLLGTSNVWVHGFFSVLATILALYKPKTLPPVTPVP